MLTGGRIETLKGRLGAGEAQTLLSRRATQSSPPYPSLNSLGVRRPFLSFEFQLDPILGKNSLNSELGPGYISNDSLVYDRMLPVTPRSRR
jgi:hypothetical protein|uniref:Uncharacterized protein n=1 Tax=Picea glauca TaxID=3330 RepID=A0A101M0A2_PICGL|nr:hypothetical protein ABT39_MTgene4664 [Picea glauca]QHR91266.1 hypothetical protein Q903MT_gene5298 [Picea sitchensis]